MTSPAVSLPRIREMVAADVEPAIDMIVRTGWGARAAWLEFAVSQPQCHPIVAQQAGEIVGTGVGTANGPAGWIGTIFVAPELRGRGLGRALTQEVIDRLGAAGCRTLVLVATAQGRQLYERMGFEVLTTEHILEAPGLADGPKPGAGAGSWSGVVRPFEPGDLDAMAALDRAATGEDRRHALVRFATPESTRIAAGPDGRVEGFVVRAPWGGGATIAPTPEVALAILDARRRASGPEGRVRVGLMASNEAGLEACTRVGFEASWAAPRMVRGERLEWRPDWIWGQFNHAMG